MSRPSRRGLASAVFVLAAVAAFGWAFAGQWDEIADRLAQQHPLVVLAALLLATAAVFASFLQWRGTLATLGSPLPVRPAARLFFVSQLGKYLPGAVWPVVAQMRLGKAMGVPRQRMGLAFLLTLGLATVVGVFLGVAALPALSRAEGPVVLLGLLALPLLALLFVPRVVNALLGQALRLLRRPPLAAPLRAGDVVRGTASMLVVWAVYGAHVWALAVGLGADPWRTLPIAVGGFALAFSLGPLLVVLPAGAGVREAVLVLLLGGVLPTPEATAVALTSRAVLMAADGLLAAAASVLAGPDPVSAGAAPPPPTPDPPPGTPAG